MATHEIFEVSGEELKSVLREVRILGLDSPLSAGEAAWHAQQEVEAYLTETFDAELQEALDTAS